MKIFLLKPNKHLNRVNNPWAYYYDMTHSFVIAAETEKEAREIAKDSTRYPGPFKNYTEEQIKRFHKYNTDLYPYYWTNNYYTTCIDLSLVEESGLLVNEYMAG